MCLLWVVLVSCLVHKHLHKGLADMMMYLLLDVSSSGEEAAAVVVQTFEINIVCVLQV